MSDPVQAQFGWHIIRLTERKDSAQKSLDDVKEQIRQILAGERQRKVYEEKLAELKKTYKVQTF
jgi:parvulin-like peptidyl-prolyl isomerase